MVPRPQCIELGRQKTAGIELLPFQKQLFDGKGTVIASQTGSSS